MTDAERRSRNRRRLAGLAFAGIISIPTYELYIKPWMDSDDDDPTPPGGHTGEQLFNPSPEVVQAVAAFTILSLAVLTVILLTKRSQNRGAAA